MKRKKFLIAITYVAVIQGVRAEEVERLSPVTVTATRMNMPMESVPVAITIVTGEEIRAQQKQSLAEILTGMVGLQVMNWGPTGALATATIRGSTSGQVLVLLDGQRLNSAQSGDFNLSDLPISVSEIERIEIIRGSASALYGQGAMAGVVHILTKRATARLQGRAAVWGARNKTLGSSLALSGVQGPFDFRASSSGETSDGYRENSNAMVGRMDGQVGMALSDRDHLEIGLNFLQKRSGVPGRRDMPQPEDTQHDQTLRLSSSMQNEFAGSLLTTRMGFSRLKSRFQDPNAVPVATVSRHTLQTGNWETQWEKSRGWQRWAMGADAFWDHLNSTDTGQKSQSRGSIFALYQVRFPQGLDAHMALRWDAHSDFADRVSPRVLLAYTWWDHLRLRLSVGRAYKAPTFNDRFWRDDGFTAGNPGVGSEVAWEYEGGIDVNWGKWGNGVIGLFQRDVHDLIEWAPDRVGKWRPSNVGKARIRGVELVMNMNPSTWMHLQANYSFLQPRNRQNGEALADRSRHELMGLGEVQLGHGFFVYLTGRFRDLVPDAKRLKNQFVVLDTGARYQAWVGSWLRWQLTCKVTNLLDEVYEIKTGYPMPPLSPQIALSAEF